MTVLLSMGICSAEWTMQAEDKNWTAGGFLEAAPTGVGIEDWEAVKTENRDLVGKTQKKESGVRSES